MAKKKNKTLLIVGLVALAGGAYWFYNRQRNATIPTPILPGDGSQSVLPSSQTQQTLPRGITTDPVTSVPMTRNVDDTIVTPISQVPTTGSSRPSAGTRPVATTDVTQPTILIAQAAPLQTATLSMPDTPAPSTGYPGDPANGITDAQKQEAIAAVQGSASAANFAQFQRVMNQFTPAEWWGVYDLYGRVPPNNGFSNMTPARIQFWHDWRVKYHFMDGTYA